MAEPGLDPDPRPCWRLPPQKVRAGRCHPSGEPERSSARGRPDLLAMGLRIRFGGVG
jgi:hypothetical protein